MRYAVEVTALLAAALVGATGTHAQAPSQGQYQSVAPKKKPAKPVDPADVATLTGRPVSQSSLAKPQPDTNASGAEDNGGNGATGAAKRPPVNPADVDILTGRNERDAARDYRWQPQGWEALWAAEWMGERGYRDESFFFVPGAFGRGARPFFFRHRFGHGFRRPFVRPLHFGRGAFFFFVH